MGLILSLTLLPSPIRDHLHRSLDTLRTAYQAPVPWCQAGQSLVDRRCVCDIAHSTCDEEDALVSLLLEPSMNASALETGREYRLRIQQHDHEGVALGNSSYDGTIPPRYFYFALSFVSERERFRLEEPTFVQDGLWEFSFHLLTEGTYEVKVLLEGEGEKYPTDPFGEHNIYTAENRVEYSPVTVKATARFRTIEPDAPFHHEAVTSLPACAPSQLGLGTAGRWLRLHNDSSVPQSFRDEFLPATELKGADYLYVAKSDCLMPYFSQKKTSTCLANKRIHLIGDSTMEEIANSLGLFLSEPNADDPASDFLPDDYKSHLGVYRGDCNQPWEPQRHMLWPISAANASIAFTWAGGAELCSSGMGTQSFESPYGRNRIIGALADPKTMLSEEDQLVRFLDEDLPLPPVPAHSDTILIYNNALHDMVSIAKEDGSGLQVSEYKEKMSSSMKLMLPYVSKAVYMTTTSLFGSSNRMIRTLNQLAVSAAEENGFSVFANYDITLSRSNEHSDGDKHHTSHFWMDHHVAPYLHARTQLLLNTLCRP
ncbi:uncharacterized protein L969DRAFT_17206 [Mixia osmundae IAM 14324]|uniref:uncharacterized protein n=1 Tax=Mixia osmundae (strain CBS 9802 / IAM 14324 / JCM 22182 / KY 12970) TaxID=764103 RepID=UPI0004A5512E|nr:uncharacterized protein L969DRAFT_17206 [Mixia osmundae IAM 14324]KEI39279.1 hypothetical protein L969DRAFT_17206 [Mixia osmundae IAM 14324]